MNILLEMHHNPSSFNPREYAIKAVETVTPECFFDIMQNPLQDRPCIAKHIKDMNYDMDAGKYGVLVLYDGVTDDALVISSSGFEYCRNAAFVPGIMSAIKQEIQNEMGDMIEDEIEDYDCSSKDETPHKLFISWDDLSDRLGFEVSIENHMCIAALGEILSFPEIKRHKLTEDGVELVIDTGDDPSTDEQD